MLRTPSHERYHEGDNVPLSRDSLIRYSAEINNRPTVLVWVTVYRETYFQLLESLAGIYRSYYELVDWKNEYENRMQLVIVVDGYKNLTKKDLKFYEKAGIYNSFCTADYKYAEINQQKSSYDIKFKGWLLN